MLPLVFSVALFDLNVEWEQMGQSSELNPEHLGMGKKVLSRLEQGLGMGLDWD